MENSLLLQTQIFHCLYHTDKNFLLGAPTGSGKTIAAEIAMFKVFRDSPEAKVVYIAPMKALVRERIADWKQRFERQLGKKVGLHDSASCMNTITELISR